MFLENPGEIFPNNRGPIAAVAKTKHGCAPFGERLTPLLEELQGLRQLKEQFAAVLAATGG